MSLLIRTYSGALEHFFKLIFSFFIAPSNIFFNQYSGYKKKKGTRIFFCWKKYHLFLHLIICHHFTLLWIAFLTRIWCNIAFLFSDAISFTTFFFSKTHQRRKVEAKEKITLKSDAGWKKIEMEKGEKVLHSLIRFFLHYSTFITYII